MSPELKTVLIALLVGLGPALIWLWFWLREDRKKPEPKGRIIISFITGMLSVFIVIPLEKAIAPNLGDISTLPLVIILGWAAIEEVIKYLASWFTALRTRVVDEPIDPIIYLITTALGFAAMENILFILDPIQNNLIIQGIITGNMRFIGATVLHFVSSGAIGFALAFSYYKNKTIKREYLIVGLIIAILLHALFNFFIINTTSFGIFIIFAFFWLVAIAMILIFEKVKEIKSNS